MDARTRAPYRCAASAVVGTERAFGQLTVHAATVAFEPRGLFNSMFAVGVVGTTGTAGGEGVRASSDTLSAIALRTVGRAEFSRSGRTTISAGHSTKAVTLAGCTSSTLVLAVLSSNRSGRYVRAVVPASGKFTIYLNTTVGSSTGVTWIAFTNPSNHGG